MASASTLPVPWTTRAFVYVCFLLSGATALVYEIVWTRQLALLAGATTPAVSTVLAVFMGGLALGARLLGPVADRGQGLLRWYAGLEVGIGVFALFQPHLLTWAGRAYLGLVPDGAAQGASLLALRLGLAVLLLLPPTILMGGTLPVLVRFVSRWSRVGRDLGTLYAVNLAGAVLGSALTGFVLIRALGVSGTLAAAALVNLSVGFLALLLASLTTVPERPSEEVEAPAAPAPPTSPALRAVLWVVVGLSGLLTMSYEVVWTRVLVFALGSTIYAFTVILVVFLLGLALGSLLFARLDGRVHGVALLAASQFLAAGSALLLSPLAAEVPEWIDRLSKRMGYTAEAQLVGMVLGGALVMLLPAVMMGIAFPLGSRLLAPSLATLGRRLGATYWVNTVGSIVGSLITGFVLLPALSIKGCLFAIAAAQSASALALLRWSGPTRRFGAALGGGGCALVFLGSALFATSLTGPSPFDRTGFAHGKPVAYEAHRDAVTATVTVTRGASGARALRINGFEASADSAAAGYMPMMSHLPMLLHGAARHVLVICFGTGSTAGAVLLHPGATVDAVEINKTVLDFAPLFRHVNHSVDRDARARLIVDDGRNYLARTRAKYDVITSEPMPPTHAGVVNLYSREYYALARERLNPGGILVQWLPFHLVTFNEARSILRTVQDVFPETTLWIHSETGLIVARLDAPVSLDGPSAARALQEPTLDQDLGRLGVPSLEELEQLFALGPEAVRDLSWGAPAVSDDHPSLEFHPLRHRFGEMVGFYSPHKARALLEVYGRRAAEEPALHGVAPEELARLRVARARRNASVTGMVWLTLARFDEADREFDAGLALAGDGAQRAPFLYGLALVAQARGNVERALVLAERCLADDPQHPSAQGLRDSLLARAGGATSR